MKAAYINPFLSGTINVLKTMASVTPTPGKPYIKKDKLSKGDISGIIGLTGAKQGSVVVSFTKDCALKIISSMMMQEYTELDDEVREKKAIAERLDAEIIEKGKLRQREEYLKEGMEELRIAEMEKLDTEIQQKRELLQKELEEEIARKKAI